MTSKVNIFVLESPLQAIHCMEARSRLNNSNAKSIVIHKVSHNKKHSVQAEKVLRMGAWTKTYAFTQNKWYAQLLIVYYILVIKLSGFEVENIFIGDMRSKWMLLVAGSIKCEKVFMVDDGAGTPIRQEADIAPAIQKAKMGDAAYDSGIVEGILLSLLFLSYLPITQLNLFTIHSIDALPGQVVIRHRYEALKSLITEAHIVIRGSCIIGSNLVNAGIISRCEYRDMIRYCAQELAAKDKEVVYYAHRWESDDEISNYKSYNLTVITPDVPLEVYFLMRKQIPSKIMSLPSFAVMSLGIIYEGMGVEIEVISV